MSRALTVFALLAFIGLVAASHFRYGSISTAKNPTNTKQITFTLNIAVRTTAFYSYASDVRTGDSVSYVIGLDYADGYSDYPVYTVNSYDVRNDVMYISAVVSHTYAASRAYTVIAGTCCRIYGLHNLESDNFYIHATFSTANADNSPVVSSLPIIFVPLSVPNYQYKLTAADDDTAALTFRNARFEEMVNYASSATPHPPGLAVSSDGTITLNQVLAQGLWCTQQVITDSAGNEIVADYLLNVAPIPSYCDNVCATPCGSFTDCNAGTCGQSPAASCLPSKPRVVLADISSTTVPRTNKPSPADGAVLTFAVGTVNKINFVADDANLANPPSTGFFITNAGLPAGVTVTPQTVCNAANGCTYVGPFSQPALRTYTFAPTAAMAGTSGVICVGVTSGSNSLSYSQHCVTVTVPIVPVSVCGNGIVETGEICDSNDACCDSTTCTLRPNTFVCRASIGSFDTAEKCTGSSVSCPADVTGYVEKPCAGYAFTVNGQATSVLNYDVVSFGDLTASTGGIGGRALIKNNANVGAGWSVGYETHQVPGDSTEDYAMVVGNNFNFPSGAVFPDGSNPSKPKENLFVGGTFTGPSYLADLRTGGPCATAGCQDAVFNAAKSCYTGLQTDLKQADNVQHLIQWSGLSITCNSATELVYYLSISSTDMSLYTYVTADNCNANARWVINVDATTDVTFSGGSFPAPDGAVTYNILGSGRTVKVQWTNLNANLIAPGHTLQYLSGQINGRIVMGQITSSAAIGKAIPFTPSL